MSLSKIDTGVGAGVLAGAALLYLAVRGSSSFDNDVTTLSTGEKPPEGQSDYDRDVEALTRMLASETGNAKAQIIIGWITLNAARSWRYSVFRLLTGKSGLYGQQKFFWPEGTKEVRYASTAKKATTDTLRIARGLFDGTIKPPTEVERTKLTSYVEILKASKKLGPDGKPLQPEMTPQRILSLQQKYGGIVGRVNNWFLYAKGKAHFIRRESDGSIRGTPCLRKLNRRRSRALLRWRRPRSARRSAPGSSSTATTWWMVHR